MQDRRFRECSTDYVARARTTREVSFPAKSVKRLSEGGMSLNVTLTRQISMEGLNLSVLGVGIC
jgi:hypothetical protein